MSTPHVKPGANARAAFRLGMIAAGLAGLVGVGLLYWAGLMSATLLAFTLLLCYPVYLVFVASALSVWLGYGKDETDLRPVYRDRDGT